MKIVSKLVKLWKKSKEQQAAKLAAKLVDVCNDLGRVPAHNGDAASINIYEYSHRDDDLELTDGSGQRIKIWFNHKGKIIKD